MSGNSGDAESSRKPDPARETASDTKTPKRNAATANTLAIPVAGCRRGRRQWQSNILLLRTKNVLSFTRQFGLNGERIFHV
jgi:hypothetical protein